MKSQDGFNFHDIETRHCTFCGTCVGICPSDALIIRNEEISQTAGCKNCGLCFDVCPGRSVDFPGMNKTLFNVEECDRNIGYYRTIARGHSSDEHIRKNASSGGVVTSLLLLLLDKGLIDGAIVVGTNAPESLKPGVMIARNREEIIRASQSKYCPVPVNAIFQTLRHVEGKFAFVGLPCHIHGLRKIQLSNRPESKKIFITLGLYCGFTMHYEGTEFLLKKLGIEKKDVIDLKYRGNGHPGGFFVKTKNNEFFLDKHIYNLINPVFVPERCLVCPDLTNEFADISVGDIWKKPDKNGWSSIIIRTPLGQEVFDTSIQEKYLNSEKLPYDDLIASHRHLITYKKEYLPARLKIIRPGIDYGTLHTNQAFSTWIAGFFNGYILLIMRSSPFKSFFSRVPLWLIDRLAKTINHRIRKA